MSIEYKAMIDDLEKDHARLTEINKVLVEALRGMLYQYEDTYGENYCECDDSVNLQCRACYARDALAKGEPK